jgi:hypothetical protein
VSKGKLAVLCTAALLLAAGADVASAAGRGGGAHGGGGGRGWHGNGGGHGHGHGHSHGYWRGGVFVGLGYYGPYWPYWGYPSYSYGYPYPTYAVDPYYSNPPSYIEQDPTMPRNAAPAKPEAFWYFCPDSRQYYPSVQSCASNWQRVPPTPPPG